MTLKNIDWRDRMSNLASRLITSTGCDADYASGKPCQYQIDMIKRIYDISVREWDEFAIDSIICDIEDHDAEILEEMADIVIENCDIPSYDTSFSDLKYNIVNSLAEDYGANVWIEYPVTCLTSIPYIVSKELVSNKGYFEYRHPPIGSWEEAGTIPMSIGYNDAQNVLFPEMIRFDAIFDTVKDETMCVPVIVRPHIENRLKLKGSE